MLAKDKRFRTASAPWEGDTKGPSPSQIWGGGFQDSVSPCSENLSWTSLSASLEAVTAVCDNVAI